jgi:hypothetical protein
MTPILADVGRYTTKEPVAVVDVTGTALPPLAVAVSDVEYTDSSSMITWPRNTPGGCETMTTVTARCHTITIDIHKRGQTERDRGRGGEERQGGREGRERDRGRETEGESERQTDIERYI